MIVTYYLDMIFIWNFVVDLIFLMLIHPRQKIIVYRVLVAAVFGAGVAVVMVCIRLNGGVLFYLIRFFCAAMMVLIGIPTKGAGELFCNIGFLYGVSGCMYGIYIMLCSMRSFSELKTIILLLSSFAVLISIRIFYVFRIKKEQIGKFRYNIMLVHKGTELYQTAFYDSGNHLFEPISGKAVILVRRGIMERLKPDSATSRIVPFSALGNSTGFLTAYRIDKMVIFENKTLKTYENVYAAVAERGLFVQEECDVILHSQQIG